MRRAEFTIRYIGPNPGLAIAARYLTCESWWPWHRFDKWVADYANAEGVKLRAEGVDFTDVIITRK